MTADEDECAPAENTLLGRVDKFANRTRAVISPHWANPSGRWYVRIGVIERYYDTGLLMLADLEQRYPEGAEVIHDG